MDAATSAARLSSVRRPSLPAGRQIAIDRVTKGGGIRCIVLPFDTLSALMMTLPRMLQFALDQWFMGAVQTMGSDASSHLEAVVA